MKDMKASPPGLFLSLSLNTLESSRHILGPLTSDLSGGGEYTKGEELFNKKGQPCFEAEKTAIKYDVLNSCIICPSVYYSGQPHFMISADKHESVCDSFYI